jgi:hypothetical protein
MMASLQALTRTRLVALVQATITAYGEDSFTLKQLAQKALPEARKICASDYDSAIAGWIRPIARRLMRKVSGPTEAPTLLPGLVLPYRIAVPRIHGMENYVPPEDEEADDETGDTGILWIPLHLCSIAEGQRNLDLRGTLIARSQSEYDRIKRVVDTATYLAKGDDSAIIGEVLP